MPGTDITAVSSPELTRAQGRLQASIASTLSVIAAVRAERQMPPIHEARQNLARIYGATRLRRRLEREFA